MGQARLESRRPDSPRESQVSAPCADCVEVARLLSERTGHPVRHSLAIVLAVLVTGACGGSVENDGNGGSGAAAGDGAESGGGTAGTAATSGGGGTTAGFGGVASGGAPGGGGGAAAEPAGGFGGVTGGTGGIDCGACGPTGAPCCFPADACAVVGEGGGNLACNCDPSSQWLCSSAGTGGVGGGFGGSGGGNGCVSKWDCGLGLACCFGQCVNTANDIINCGACGNVCGGLAPYCDGVQCGAPPCQVPGPLPPGAVCCGTHACAPGVLCCKMGSGMLGCHKPENGTCPHF